MRFCVFEHASYGVLGLLLDLPQVTFTAEALGIDLVNILRAGRPRGKPSVLGNHLNSTERKTVPRSGGKLRADWLAGKFRHADPIGRERLQHAANDVNAMIDERLWIHYVQVILAYQVVTQKM